MPWPKGKPRSPETIRKLLRGNAPVEVRRICVCGAKKNPYRLRCRACVIKDPIYLAKLRGAAALGGSRSKTQIHKERIAESNQGKHKHKGSLNPNYRGGITTLNHSLRTSDKYRVWQAAVIAKASGKCESCGESVWKLPRGGYACHHKKAFRLLILDAIKNNPGADRLDACLDYAPLWDVFNRSLFHRSCHLKLHRELRSSHVE